MQKQKKKPEQSSQQVNAVEAQGAIGSLLITTAPVRSFGGSDVMLGGKRPPAPPGVIPM
jgi:hypothetical protein